MKFLKNLSWLLLLAAVPFMSSCDDDDDSTDPPTDAEVAAEALIGDDGSVTFTVISGTINDENATDVMAGYAVTLTAGNESTSGTYSASTPAGISTSPTANIDANGTYTISVASATSPVVITFTGGGTNTLTIAGGINSITGNTFTGTWSDSEKAGADIEAVFQGN